MFAGGKNTKNIIKIHKNKKIKFKNTTTPMRIYSKYKIYIKNLKKS